MKHAVILDDAAARDLKDHLSHLASVSPGAERALWEDFAHLLELLSDFPQLHQNTAVGSAERYWSAGRSVSSIGQLHVSSLSSD